MGSGPVVVLGVRADHSLQVSSSTGERPVQTLRAYGPKPSLREGVGPWRGADHLDTLAAEDLVEGARALRVAVAEEVPHVAELTAICLRGEARRAVVVQGRADRLWRTDCI